MQTWKNVREARTCRILHVAMHTYIVLKQKKPIIVVSIFFSIPSFPANQRPEKSLPRTTLLKQLQNALPGRRCLTCAHRRQKSALNGALDLGQVPHSLRKRLRDASGFKVLGFKPFRSKQNLFSVQGWMGDSCEPCV